jgi:tetrahydromethanopterin S-methyltransferase subunit G
LVASMAVMAREAWTDERLDDFKENVNRRFDEVDRRFDQVDKRFDKVDARLDKIDTRIDSMQRTMIICFCGMTTSIVASVIGASFLG